MAFLRLNGRRNDKRHQRGADAKTRQPTAETSCFSSGWVQLVRRVTRGSVVKVNTCRWCVRRRPGDFVEMRGKAIEDEAEGRLLCP